MTPGAGVPGCCKKMPEARYQARREVAAPELSVNTFFFSWSRFRSTHTRSVHHANACAGSPSRLSSQVAPGQHLPAREETARPTSQPRNPSARRATSRTAPLRQQPPGGWYSASSPPLAVVKVCSPFAASHPRPLPPPSGWRTTEEFLGPRCTNTPTNKKSALNLPSCELAPQRIPL